MADLYRFEGEISAATKEDLSLLQNAISSTSSGLNDGYNTRLAWGEVETDRGVFEHFDVLQFAFSSAVGIALNVIASAIYDRIAATNTAATLSAEPDGSYKISIGSSSVHLAISEMNDVQQHPKTD
jgi:hypothetical protein